MKEYRSNNKEIGKIYYEKNKESILEANKAYREKNKTEIYNKHKEHVEKNKVKIARYKKDYEEQRKANGFVRIRNKEKKREDSRSYHLDHFVPLSKRGLNVIKNIVLSCAKCNLSKGAMMPEDFAKKIKKVINNDNRI